ncbi:hypothetical protein LXL04_016081 [Taraxacum kok-saghyz]
MTNDEADPFGLASPPPPPPQKTIIEVTNAVITLRRDSYPPELCVNVQYLLHYPLQTNKSQKKTTSATATPPRGPTPTSDFLFEDKEILDTPPFLPTSPIDYTGNIDETIESVLFDAIEAAIPNNFDPQTAMITVTQ